MAKTLSELWTDTVQADPQALALADASDGRRWTRAELAAAAGECRAQLPAGGEFRGRYVVLAETNGIRWLSRFLGLLAAGAIPALVDPGEPPDAQAAVGRRIGAVGVWSGESALRILPGARPRRRDYCLAKITSGTTGLPKALPFTHAQMVADGRQICASMAIGPQDVNLAAIPFGHSYGLGNLVIPLLVQGTALVCSPGPFPQAIAATCAAWRPSVFPAVPAILRALAQADVAASDLASLREVLETVQVSDQLVDYAVQVVRRTRTDDAILVGAGPRASQALLCGARAWAALSARDFVTPDDIHALALPVLEHRLLLRPESELEGVCASEVLDRILHEVPVPR